MMNGLGVSEGIGIGKAVVLKKATFDLTMKKSQAELEQKRYSEASIALTEILNKKSSEVHGEQSEIIDSHVVLLNDPAIYDEVVNLIKKHDCNCEYAIDQVFSGYADMFLATGDELMMARASDINDIKNNLLTILHGEELVDIAHLPTNTILVADEITTSVAASISPDNIAGIITRLGGATSHTAIIARSLGIPAVMGVDIEIVKNGEPVVMNGSTGELIVNPTQTEQRTYAGAKEKELAEKKELEQYRGQPSCTQDGKTIKLFANVGLSLDIDNAVKADAEGIGLFRTEFLYMDRAAAPTEEEQYQLYKKAIGAFPTSSVIIRTLDIGGDKAIPYLEMEKEENPFLGWRAIRYCLDKREIFKTQLRAILRASAYGDIKIMLPMISTVTEFEESVSFINSIKEQLSSEKIQFNQDIDIGIMIETPAAAIMADQLAKKSAFFSIGTNDLTQYTMAVDRGNKKVAHLYSEYNPAVLRLIKNVIDAANNAGILCGICGEAGSDPLLIPFLIGCGIKELSMNASSILKARKTIRQVSFNSMQEIVNNELPLAADRAGSVTFLKKLNF